MKSLLLVFIMVFCVGCQGTEDYGLSLEIETSKLSKIPLTLSWQIETEENRRQNAYQIMLFTKKNNKKSNDIVWDSGKVESQENLYVPYLGPSLNSSIIYYFKVRIWDSNGNTSEWSNIKPFVAPLKYPDNWKAEWITYDYSQETALPIFRKEFNINKSEELDFIKFSIAAPGFYEAYLNGTKVGKKVLDPAQTNYDDYMFYSDYVIPNNQLKSKNVLGIMLGNGWYNQNLVWGGNMSYGQPVFMAQMELYYKNGKKEIVGSDSSWFWKEGPITFSNIYAGESYNATKEANDWFSYVIDNSKWNSAIKAKNHPEKVEKQFVEPIKVMDSIQAKRILPLNNGKYIFDFGQNFAGWTRLKIQGEKGQEITIRFAEELGKDGQMDFRSTGEFATKVKQTEKYICKGEGIETWEPRFTYHGFRYAEISGLKQNPGNDLLMGMIVYSSMQQNGSFKTSEYNINKLHKLALWTFKSNLQGIPTDCPHREKCGWSGDAHAMAKTLIYNYNAHKFLTKYLFDMRSSGKKETKDLFFGEGFYDRRIKVKPKGITTMIAPGKRTSGIATPDWGTAIVQIPWYLYLYYGDKEVLKEFYKDMKAWVAYVHSQTVDGIVPNGLGDWFPPGGIKNMDCPVSLSSTAFHVLDISILRETARVLGKDEDENKYSKMEEELKEKFNLKFLDIEKQTYGTQTANSIALEMGLVPKNYKKGVAKSIVIDSDEKFDSFLNTGIFGLPRLFQALCENGFEEKAFQLLTKEGNNSFENMWKEYDATTLWEILPTSLIETNNLHMMMERSHNHPMQGGYDAWFFSGIGGINPSPEEPGFKKIILKPYLTRQIGSAEVSYKSSYGMISSSWGRKGKHFTWKVNIPNNSTADIYLPNYGKNMKLSINGDYIDFKDYSSDFTYIGEYPSGVYSIEMESL